MSETTLITSIVAVGIVLAVIGFWIMFKFYKKK